MVCAVCESASLPLDPNSADDVFHLTDETYFRINESGELAPSQMQLLRAYLLFRCLPVLFVALARWLRWRL